MSAWRVAKWSALAVLLVAGSAFGYAGAVAAQGYWHSHGGPSGPTYNTTFNESGLSAGTNWSVSISGHGGWHHFFRGHFERSNAPSITFALPNGTYHYRIHPVPGYALPSPASGTINVSGASPAVVSVSFAKLEKFTVTFTETGLPSGTNWSVAVAGGGHGDFGPRHHFATSSTSTITFSLTNGTYRYFVFGVAGYAIADNGSHGVVNVSGASPPAVTVTFDKLATYAVTFTETGLPSGTNWSVVVLARDGWGPSSVVVGTSNGTTISFELTNGTYVYFVGHVPGYMVSSGRFGELTVAGASPPTVDVTFVAFSIAGAPPSAPLAGVAAL
jgi:hypothetical protein